MNDNMKKYILDLADEAGFLKYEGELYTSDLEYMPITQDALNFAELIIQECIKQAHAVSDLRGINDDMIYGADTAALRISKHFGLES